jgi:hypothetical protein
MLSKVAVAIAACAFSAAQCQQGLRPTDPAPGIIEVYVMPGDFYQLARHGGVTFHWAPVKADIEARFPNAARYTGWVTKQYPYIGSLEGKRVLQFKIWVDPRTGVNYIAATLYETYRKLADRPSVRGRYPPVCRTAPPGPSEPPLNIQIVKEPLEYFVLPDGAVVGPRPR